MMGFSYEKRYLKRPRLGPPDVYPQEPRQKEVGLHMFMFNILSSLLPNTMDARIHLAYEWL